MVWCVAVARLGSGDGLVVFEAGFIWLLFNHSLTCRMIKYEAEFGNFLIF